MMTTNCIKYESSAISDKLDTIFCNTAKPALYEGVTIFSEPADSPKSIFSSPKSIFSNISFDNMFADGILPYDYKVFNDKVVVAYFKDGTKEKAVVQDGDTFDVNTGLEICILKHIGTRYGINFHNAFRKNKKAIDKKHEKNIAKKAEAERKKNATKAKLERKKRKRKEEQIDTIAKAIIKAQCSDDGCDCEG